jgi:hypothetical protein
LQRSLQGWVGNQAVDFPGGIPDFCAAGHYLGWLLTDGGKTALDKPGDYERLTYSC